MIITKPLKTDPTNMYDCGGIVYQVEQKINKKLHTITIILLYYFNYFEQLVGL